MAAPPDDTELPMTPAELATAVEDQIALILDPVERYRVTRVAAASIKTALAQAARSAVNEMWDAGARGPAIAAALGVSQHRARQLVDPARLAAARSARPAAKTAEEAS